MSDFNSPTPGSGQQKINSSTARDGPRRVNSKNHRPGRQLDALIAERVFGWRQYRQADYPPNSERAAANCWHRPFKPAPCSLPKFSTDMSAAWLVLKDMASPGFEVRLHASGAGTFDVEWWLEDNDESGPRCLAEITDVDTAPFAICLAALDRFVDLAVDPSWFTPNHPTGTNNDAEVNPMTTPDSLSPSAAPTKCPNPECVNGRVGNIGCAVCKGLQPLAEDTPIGKHGPYGSHTAIDGSPASPLPDTPGVSDPKLKELIDAHQNAAYHISEVARRVHTKEEESEAWGRMDKSRTSLEDYFRTLQREIEALKKQLQG